MLWKNIILDKYIGLEDNIYVNAHPNGNGDFHFIMNNVNSHTFKNLYDSALIGNVTTGHFFIKNYVTKFMKKKNSNGFYSAW